MKGWARRVSKWASSLGAGAVLVSVVAGLPAVSHAGSLDQAVISELLAAQGWSPVGADASAGLSMYEKPLKSVGLTAYMGVRDLPADVDVDRLWALIVDVVNHDRVTNKLVESTLVARHGGAVDFYQVLKPPPLMASAQRYWFVHSVARRDVDGTPGHHRRCWSGLREGEAAEVRAKVAAAYPDASEIPLTHGCWEVVPAVAGAPARLRYRTVSDPGGTLARTALSLLTTRTLPENLAAFIDAARR